MKTAVAAGERPRARWRGWLSKKEFQMRWLKSLIAAEGGHERIEELPIEQISVREGHGPHNEANAVVLTQSIEELGRILHALYVSRRGSEFVLEMGYHRLIAAGRAGLKTVPCIIIENEDELIVELARHHENLARNILGPSDFAISVARCDEIVTEVANRPVDELSQSATTSERVPGSIRYQAERTGVRKDKWHRGGKRGRMLGEDILKKTRGTSLDKDVELDALAKLPAEQRTALASRAEDGERVSARTSDGKPKERSARSEMEPPAKALGGFCKWLEENPWVQSIALLKGPIAKIKAALSADEPDKPHPA